MQEQPSGTKSWILPSFEDIVQNKKGDNMHGKERKGSLQQPNVNSQDVSWLELCVPNNKQELIVHKKKIAEVETWLLKNCHMCEMKVKLPILLLCGPNGAGKTATVKTICKEMNVEIIEWSTLPQISSRYQDFKDGVNFKPGINYENQATSFINFLLRCNRYSIFEKPLQRIILIKEFPNVFFQNPTAFHQILREYVSKGKFPVVFILSESTKGETLENCLFPKTLQLTLNISKISFNPVAPTMMVKMLKNMHCKLKHKVSKKNAVRIDEIAADSMGDIRCAINTLQFLSAFEPSKSNISESGKEVLEKAKSIPQKWQKDTSLFLFHALGKILHCKRIDPQATETKLLPPHLKHLDRNQLREVPEDVFTRTSLSAESFALFLHENYISFAEDLYIAADCSAWFSEADAFLHNFGDLSILSEYSASVASRGLMFNLASSPVSNKWKSLHKPQLFNFISIENTAKKSVKNVFQDKSISSFDLLTELIPFQYRIGAFGSKHGEALLVKQLSEIPTKTESSHLTSVSLNKNGNYLKHGLKDFHAEDAAECFESDLCEDYIIEDYDS